MYDHKAYMKEYNKQYYALNREKLLARYRDERYLQAHRDWYQRNREEEIPKAVKRGAAYKRRMKEQLVEAFGGACVRCGYYACMAALDFHHRDPTTKKFNVGSRSIAFERQLEEAKKCDLVCANCHREIEFSSKDEHIHLGLDHPNLKERRTHGKEA